MKLLHHYLDMDLHKKCLFISITMAMLVTNGIIACSSITIWQTFKFMSIGQFLPNMASFTLLSNAQVILTVVYLYLLLNARVRFHQLNNILR